MKWARNALSTMFACIDSIFYTDSSVSIQVFHGVPMLKHVPFIQLVSLIAI